MDQGTVALIATLSATLVAVSGYIFTQAQGRRERRAKQCAEALRAMRDYQDVPSRILRRGGNDSSTRERLSSIQLEASSAVRYHLTLLQIESPISARAYQSLFQRAHLRNSQFRDWAWSQSPSADDPAMGLNPPFNYKNDEELALCIRAMRYELRLLRSSGRKGPLVAAMVALEESRRDDKGTTFDELEIERARKQEKRAERRSQTPAGEAPSIG